MHNSRAKPPGHGSTHGLVVLDPPPPQPYVCQIYRRCTYKIVGLLKGPVV